MPDRRAFVNERRDDEFPALEDQFELIILDPAGYAANLESFDARLPGIIGKLRDDDLLVITADHGNDPTTPSTDHSREHVPVLLYGGKVKAGADLGTRETFADLGQTLAEIFGVGPLANGTSFMPVIVGGR